MMTLEKKFRKTRLSVLLLLGLTVINTAHVWAAGSPAAGTMGAAGAGVVAGGAVATEATAGTETTEASATGTSENSAPADNTKAAQAKGSTDSNTTESVTQPTMTGNASAAPSQNTPSNMPSPANVPSFTPPPPPPMTTLPVAVSIAGMVATRAALTASMNNFVFQTVDSKLGQYDDAYQAYLEMVADWSTIRTQIIAATGNDPGATPPPFSPPPVFNFAENATDGTTEASVIKQGDWTLWTQAMGSKEKQSMRKGENGYHSHGGGGIIGFDRALPNDQVVGGSFSFNKTVVKPMSLSYSKTTVDTYLVTTTYSKDFPILSFSGSVYAGVNRNNVIAEERQDLYYTSKTEGMSLTASKNLPIGNFNLSPSYTLSGSLSQQNAYLENGENYYKRSSSRSMQSDFGLNLSRGFTTENGDQHNLSASTGVGYNHTIKPNPVTVNTQTGVITVQSTNQPRLIYNFGSGYGWTRGTVSVDLNVGVQVKSKYLGQNFTVKLSKKF